MRALMSALMWALITVFMAVGVLFCSVLLLGVMGAIDLRICIASPSQCPAPASNPDVDERPTTALLWAAGVPSNHLTREHQQGIIL